ncbi:GMC family oxidoreductase [Streptomyces sp. NPDC006995]|uniref:GMC family oxidoreductase n=1 Tax=unclassified Streptomyces TaxID=2593676 RepID=UPI0033DDCC1A
MSAVWGPGTPPVVVADQDEYRADVAVVGSGAGGATIAEALADSGARVLVLERGDFLPHEPENWEPEAVLGQRRYDTTETWSTPSGERFRPMAYYNVGGATKIYGAALMRMRESDFGVVEHLDGLSPAWPFAYSDLEPYYGEAERLFKVHGRSGVDPTEPPRSTPFAYPPLAHEPMVAELSASLERGGLHPHHLELGIQRGPGEPCVRCGTCDCFPCLVSAKSDAEVVAMRPALRSDTVRLLTGTRATRLHTDPTGRRVTGISAVRAGRTVVVRAGVVVVSCGAVNSAVLLLRSPAGAGDHTVANSSGLVGRNLMFHNNSVVLAVDPRRRNTVRFQKTLAVNDFYRGGPGFPYPMGNLQLMGKVYPPAVAGLYPYVPGPVLAWLLRRSVDWWVMSEDLPDPGNRVVLRGGRIVVDRRARNIRAHHRLVSTVRSHMRDAGYPLTSFRTMGPAATGHQCGTVVAGTDPRTSVLDGYCRSHDVRNLFVVDAGFFPSSAAVNPTLTIVAQALRTARHGGLLPA